MDMTEHERGAYAPPTEGGLAFERRQPVRGSRPFPTTLVASVLVLIGLGGAIFFFYRSGVREANQPPRVVGEPVGGLKAAAPADAQPQDPAAGLQIYRSEAGQPAQPAAGPPQFTAPPEQPQPRPEPGPVVKTLPSAQTAAVPAKPPAPATPPPTQVATAAPPPTAAALRPSQPAPAPEAAKTKAPSTPPAPTVAKAPPAPPKPKPVETATATSAPAKAKPEPQTVVPGQETGVSAQVGAVSSVELADATWNKAVAAAPGLAAGKGKGVERVDKDGKTLYRTTVTGFATKADAKAFCAKLTAAGKACFVR